MRSRVMELAMLESAAKSRRDQDGRESEHDWDLLSSCGENVKRPWWFERKVSKVMRRFQPRRRPDAGV